LIEIKKPKLNKKHLAIIITASLLVLLIVGYVVIEALIRAGGSGNSGGVDVEYDASIGESHSNGSPTLYPLISTSKMTTVLVESHNGSFMMMRPTGSDGALKNYFQFYYEVDGKLQAYLPDITSAEPSFNYTSFYSTTSDGINMPKIEYLLASLANLSYTYKIPMNGTADSEERKNQLELYGLDEETRQTISFEYYGADGSKKKTVIHIGDKLLGESGRGYYIALAGRDYIYASTGSQNFSYALAGFESFLHSRVVAAGLSSDKTFEPYLTTGYEQWNTEYFDYYTDDKGNKIPYTVTEDAEVILLADILIPVYSGTSYLEPESDGYYHLGYEEVSFKLKAYKDKPAFSRLVSAVSSKSVDLEERGEDTVVTVVNGMNEAKLFDAEKNSGKYTYEITAIESVITDTEERFEGSVGEGAVLVKVTYNYKVDGGEWYTGAHAVLDLSKETTAGHLGADNIAAIRAASVGKLADSITFEVTYGKDDTAKQTISYVITEIAGIYKLDGDKTVLADSVDASCVVVFTYYTRMTDSSGKVTKGDVYTNQMVDLSAITEAGYNLDIKNALIGKTVGVQEINVKVGEVYYQIFDDFTEYRIKQICGFVSESLDVAFKFQNESERDPFYGETTYTNIMGEVDPGNDRALQALNVEACDKAVRIFGGISLDGASQTSSGLVGSETVAVGLTPSVMRRYNLYSGYRIYFELPRNIGEDPYNKIDYKWDYELGFTLYISNTDIDGYRYIASDMYDIVVKIEGSQFDFLDESFADFWARRNLVMIDHSNIDKVTFDLNFPNLVGKYSFRLDHKTVYIIDNKHYDKQQYDDKGNSVGQAYNFVTVFASIAGFEEGKSSLDGVYTETGLSKLLSSLGTKEFSLAELYNRLYSDDGTYKYLSAGNDTLGTAYFKELLMVTYATYYMGSLDPDSDEVKNALDGEPLMSISFDVTKASALYSYVYDFYRLDDRRIAVNFYRRDADGNREDTVTELYITDLAFEKIYRNLLNLLNGDDINPDVGYEDIK